MKDHVIRKLRNNLRCRNDIDEDRLARENAPQRFLIGLFDKFQWAGPWPRINFGAFPGDQ